METGGRADCYAENSSITQQIREGGGGVKTSQRMTLRSSAFTFFPNLPSYPSLCKIEVLICNIKGVCKPRGDDKQGDERRGEVSGGGGGGRKERGRERWPQLRLAAPRSQIKWWGNEIGLLAVVYNRHRFSCRSFLLYFLWFLFCYRDYSSCYNSYLLLSL